MENEHSISLCKLLSVPHLVMHGFLAAEEREALLHWAVENQARFNPATLGKGRVDMDIRQSMSLRDLGPSDLVLRRYVTSLLSEWIRDLRVAPFMAGEIELELVAHNDGAHYAPHTDMRLGTTSRRGHRMLSGVYYFYREPKGFSGGALRMHRFGALQAQTGFTDIPPAQNSFVVFPSWGPHEVRPVACPSRNFADSRFAVNCWVYRRQ